MQEKQNKGDPKWYLALGAAASVATILTLFFTVLHPADAKNTTVNANTVLGTPTSQSITSLELAPYTAPIPGAGCDKGDGAWTEPDDGHSTTICTAQGLKLDRPHDSQYLPVIRFTWPHHPFPRDYKVAVDISFVTYTCAGIFTRDIGTGSYGAFICRDGRWHLYKYVTQDSKTTTTELKSGTVTSKAFYHLEVSPLGDVINISLDGSAIAAVDDATFPNTNRLGLGIYDCRCDQITNDVYAYFSNFVYTPLSQ